MRELERLRRFLCTDGNPNSHRRRQPFPDTLKQGSTWEVLPYRMHEAGRPRQPYFLYRKEQFAPQRIDMVIGARTHFPQYGQEMSGSKKTRP